MTIKPWFAKAVRRGMEQAKKDVADYGARYCSPTPFLMFGHQDRANTVCSDAYVRTYERLIAARFSGLTDAEVNSLVESAAYWRATSGERKYLDARADIKKLEARVKALESI